MLLNVRVVEGDAPSPDAQITCRITMPSGPATYVYSNTNPEGVAEVRVPAPEAEAVITILIQAAVRGKSASRKFNLKRL